MKHILSENTRTRLTGVEQVDVQPNAIDLRIDRVFRIRPSTFVISEDIKTHRLTEEIDTDADGWWELDTGAYEVTMSNVINVGEHEAGWVITRSSLNRNGLTLSSGLYDSGYHGAMAAVLHVEVGTARIQRGTRVGQYLCFEAEMLHAYDGSYGFDADGKPKTEEQKYHKEN